MTAILGFNCTDGVLLLADTEETTSADTKSECNKLTYFNCPHGRVLLGGAGNSHYIEYATQYMMRRFLQQPRTWQEIESDLKDISKQVFKDTVGQYKGFPFELIPEDIAFLIAVHSDKNTLLFRWEQGTVTSIPRYLHGSIGVGNIQTQIMLQDVQLSAPVDVMLLHAIRIMRQTKRIVRGCGGKTDAIALHNDGTRGHIFTGVTENIEELIEEFEKFSNNELLILMANGFSEETKQHLDNVPTKLMEFREKYRRIMH